MEPLVFLPPILVVAGFLLWSRWSSRGSRDPSATVDHFSRALHAMQPAADGPPPQRDIEADAATEEETSEPLPQRS